MQVHVTRLFLIISFDLHAHTLHDVTIHYFSSATRGALSFHKEMQNPRYELSLLIPNLLYISNCNAVCSVVYNYVFKLAYRIPKQPITTLKQFYKQLFIIIIYKKNYI